jgi:hypothetical protein
VLGVFSFFLRFVGLANARAFGAVFVLRVFGFRFGFFGDRLRFFGGLLRGFGFAAAGGYAVKRESTLVRSRLSALAESTR